MEIDTTTDPPIEDPFGYNPTVIDHFQNPRNTGELANANAVGSARNQSCGDYLKLFLRIEDGRIAAVRFKTYGCGAAIAASSALTELLDGRTIAEALVIRDEDIVAHLGGLPSRKVDCSVFAAAATRAAIEDYQSQCRSDA